MKKQRLAILAVLPLLFALGCSVKTTRILDPTVTATVQASPQTSTHPPTSITPSRKMQITYVQFVGNTLNTEFIGVGITCMEEDNFCLSEPISLFTTLYDSSDNSKPAGSIRGYDWSLDGEGIVLSANKDLFISDINIESWENVTASPDVEEYEPKWSQDKKYIYFLSCTQDVTGMGSCKLARLNLNDNTNAFLLDSINDSIASFAISPNGRNVIFSIADLLYQSNLDGSDKRLITSTKAEENSPNFSPDGRLIVFVRTNAPTRIGDSRLVSDIILRDLETGEEKNLTEDFEDEASSPVFSSDGKWIAFEGFGLDRKSHIYVGSLDGAVILQVTHGNFHEFDPVWRLIDEH